MSASVAVCILLSGMFFSGSGGFFSAVNTDSLGFLVNLFLLAPVAVAAMMLS